MNPTKLLTAICIAAAAVSAPVAAQQTKILTADKHNEYGLIYSLPLTELKIEVTATQTVKKAGPYWQYAKKYIGTDKVITSDEESWVINSATVSSYGVADPDSRFIMQLKPGALTSITVADDGMLLAINAEAPAPAAAKPRKAAAAPKVFSGKEYLQYVNEDFIASQSSAKQAQLLSESLMEVRDAKVSLTRGTAETMPTDGEQLRLMLNSLAEQESALTAAFAGTETQSTVSRTFTFRPEKAGKRVLFRLSDFSGFTDADDYSGEPVYLEISDIQEPALPVDEKGEEKRLPKDAVVYALPGEALVKISAAGATIFEQKLQIAQFGTTFGLAPSLFTDKKAPSYAIFDPATGALREIAEIKNN